MVDTKNVLASKGIQGPVAALAGLLMIVLPRLGVQLGDGETMTVAGCVVVLLGALWGAIGRVAASTRLTLGRANRGGTALVLLMAVAILAGGCAVKKVAAMSGPDAARSVSYELLQTYRDLHASYLDAYPGLSPDKQALAREKVAPAMDKAKLALLALASAANGWSLAAGEEEVLAEEVFRGLWSEAAAILNHAQNLYAQIMGAKE